LSETSECVDCLVNTVDVLLLLAQHTHTSQLRSSLAIIYLSTYLCRGVFHLYDVINQPYRLHPFHHVIYSWLLTNRKYSILNDQQMYNINPHVLETETLAMMSDAQYKYFQYEKRQRS